MLIEDRLRIFDDDVAGPDLQPRCAVLGEQVGKHLQGRSNLVGAVGRALDDRRVRAERGVVHEGAVRDAAEVDAEVDAVGERVQAGGGVVPVEAEIQGEVVAGAGRDDEERHVMAGRDRGDQGLGTVAARHPEQIGAGDHRALGQLRDVLRPSGIEHDDLGPELTRLLHQPEPFDLASARPRIHDEERPS
ncbi:hypothetical protein QP089_07100 [Actinomadura sp. OS1-43]|nr:hypothetical protein [Actinomadura sp. OS1-43]MDL4814027.1 hypothetical protein [Actinomadura sp. OS1-43]